MPFTTIPKNVVHIHKKVPSNDLNSARKINQMTVTRHRVTRSMRPKTSSPTSCDTAVNMLRRNNGLEFILNRRKTTIFYSTKRGKEVAQCIRLAHHDFHLNESINAVYLKQRSETRVFPVNVFVDHWHLCHTNENLAHQSKQNENKLYDECMAQSLALIHIKSLLSCALKQMLIFFLEK